MGHGVEGLTEVEYSNFNLAFCIPMLEQLMCSEEELCFTGMVLSGAVVG